MRVWRDTAANIQNFGFLFIFSSLRSTMKKLNLIVKMTVQFIIVVQLWMRVSIHLNQLIKVNFCQAKNSRLKIFAGQGTQQPKMLDHLLSLSSAKQDIISFSQQLDIDFIAVTTQQDKKQQLTKTYITQPLIVMSQCLTMKYLREKQSQDCNQYGISINNILIGHSIGEYSALVGAGSLDLMDCLKLVKKRGQMMTEFTKKPSGMLFVRFSDAKKQQLDRILQKYSAQIAGYNTFHNIIIAGDLEKLGNIREQLRKQKITSIYLPVSAAFHCQELTPMQEPFRNYLNMITIKEPICQIYRNCDCSIYKTRSQIIEGLTEHLTKPVRFYQSALKVLELHPGIEVQEIGHKQSLLKFIKQIKKVHNFT